MRVGTLNQIKIAAINICNEETWNNTDANYLLNQAELIEDRMPCEPATMRASTWDNYERTRAALCEKLDICHKPHLAKVV